MIQQIIVRRQYREDMDALCLWLSKHDIKPAMVVADEDIEIGPDYIEVTQYVFDAFGKLVFDKPTGISDPKRSRHRYICTPLPLPELRDIKVVTLKEKS